MNVDRQGERVSHARGAAEQTRHVWIVNHHAVLPSKDGREGRHLAFARHLTERGWSASLIVASTTHPSGRQRLNGHRLRKISVESGVSTVWVRTCSYRSMGRRIVGMAMFAVGALLPGATRSLRRPDAVIGSTVHPLAAWSGWRLARRHGVPFIYEIRDVWPETLVDLGRLKASGLRARAMTRLSRHLVARADLVISPLARVDRYLADLGFDDKQFLWLSNGIEPAAAEPALPAHAGFTFMYTGAHGVANGLEGLLEAFDIAQSSAPDIDLHLRLVGDGPRKPALIEYSRTLASRESIHFEEQVPQSRLADRVEDADCMIANVLDQPVYRYGLSLNKLFFYLDSSRPTVLAADSPNPISEAGAGICVQPGSVAALADAIVHMANTPLEARITMARRGREHVRERYSYEDVTRRLAEALDALVTPGVRPHRLPSVVHVSSAHPWTDNRIHYRECLSLSALGYPVTLVAVEPTVPGPVGDVRVLALPRMSRWRRVVIGAPSALVRAWRTGARVFHLHDPELAWAIPLLRLLGKKVIFDAHEDLPVQVVSKQYLGPLLRVGAVGLAHVLVRLGACAHHIIAATETIAQRFPSGKVTVVHNYPPLREEEGTADPVASRSPTAVYVGTIGLNRGVREMVAAAQSASFPAGWRLEIVGHVPSSVRTELAEPGGSSGAVFTGALAPQEARDRILGARVGLVLLRDTPAYRDSLPTKMFEYFAAGVPVIASDFARWREIVERVDGGVLVDETDPDAIAVAIAGYAHDPGLLARHSVNARRAAVDEFNWDREVPHLAHAYRKALER